MTIQIEGRTYSKKPEAASQGNQDDLWENEVINTKYDPTVEGLNIATTLALGCSSGLEAPCILAQIIALRRKREREMSALTPVRRANEFGRTRSDGDEFL